MLLTELEMEVYGKEQCEGLQLKKIKEFHEKLNIDDLMTLKGMYIIFHKELKALNLNKIHNFEQLCKKRKRYRKYLKTKVSSQINVKQKGR